MRQRWVGRRGDSSRLKRGSSRPPPTRCNQQPEDSQKAVVVKGGNMDLTPLDDRAETIKYKPSFKEV